MSKVKLRGYQKRAVKFICKKKKCALWLDMGLGKTLITLTAIDRLLRKAKVSKILVVAPLQPILHTWPEEIEKYKEQLTNISYVTIRGTPARRIELLQSDAHVHLINIELLIWMCSPERVSNWGYDIIVLDESRSYKSNGSGRTRAVLKVSELTKYIVQLSGTPATGGLIDLFSQIKILDGGRRLGKTLYGFKHQYFKADYMGYNLSPLRRAAKAIANKVSDICLQMSSSEYLELPAVSYVDIKVDLGPEQAKQYAELEKNSVLEMADGDISAVNAAVLINKLLQFCNGAMYKEYTRDPAGAVASGTGQDKARPFIEIHDKKLEALAEIVEQNAGRNILLAYNYKSDAERIKTKFKHAVDIKEPGAYEKWCEGKISLLIAHPASAGHGLNLQSGGSLIVWFGLPWSLDKYLQFNARLNRSGQKRGGLVIHLIVSDSVELDVKESLSKHTKTLDNLLRRVSGAIKVSRSIDSYEL